MKKSPCFPLYPSDFFGDVKVRMMSPDAQAFYLLLLANIWEFDTQYSVPDDEILISNLLRIDQHRLGILFAEMRPCFMAVKGRLVSRRLKQEKEKQDKYRKMQADKGRASVKQRLSRGSTAVQPRGEPEVNSSNPKPIPKPKKIKQYSIAFEEFYLIYPKRVGKDPAWKAWQKRTDLPDIEELKKAVSIQKESDQWKRGYIPNPATWINQARWTDELQSQSSTVPVNKRPSPYVTCRRCGNEYLETDVIEVSGNMCCPKCPDTREQSDRLAKAGIKSVMDKIAARAP